jgi:Cu/Ag efflux protein CusF
MLDPISETSGKRNVPVRPLRYRGTMLRLPTAVVAGVFLACLGWSCERTAAFAAPSAPSVAPSAAYDALSAKDAGSIDGHVKSIDYNTGLMTVEVAHGAKKTYEVMVVPGTSIVGAKDFHTIADLKKGAHVQVLMSQHGSTYTAQSIRLL